MPARPSAPGTPRRTPRPRSRRAPRKRGQHLGRRDVLALPPEGLADAVDEVIEAGASRRIRSPVRYQASPGLNTLRSTLRSVAPRPRSPRSGRRAGLRRRDQPDRLARPHPRRSARRSPRRRAAARRFEVEAQQRHRQAVRQERRYPADRARLALAVVRAKNCPRSRRSTRGCAGCESARWNASQTSAAARCRRPCAASARSRSAGAASSRGSGTARRCIGTACSPRHAHHARNPRPRTRSRITTAPPPDQHRADRHHAADAVIERQAVVHAVLGTRVEQARKPLAPAHQPVMVRWPPSAARWCRMCRCRARSHRASARRSRPRRSARPAGAPAPRPGAPIPAHRRRSPRSRFRSAAVHAPRRGPTQARRQPRSAAGPRC